jgi:Protein of unknown function (DUF1769)
MGLRTSLRLRPTCKQSEQSRVTKSLPSSSPRKENVENSISTSDALTPKESNAAAQSLHATLPLTQSIADDSTCSNRLRRSRFSLRISRNKGNKQSANAQVDSQLQDAPVQKSLADDIQKPSRSSTPSTSKRSGGLKLLRRLSSPISLQHFSSNGARADSSGGSKDTSEESHGGFQTDDSDENNALLNPLSYQSSNTMVVRRTTVVPESFSPPRGQRVASPVSPITEEPVDDDDLILQQKHKFECATAILQHSYLERICGVGRHNTSFDDYVEERPSRYTLPEDPTVQESIECIFASQLENGLKLWDEGGEDISNSSSDSLGRLSKRQSQLISPADLQQSRMNRKDRKNSADLSMNQIRKRYEQASLVYVGTYDPNVDQEEVIKNMVKTSDGHVEPLPCTCHSSHVPSLKPEDWPQAPILLRPTPGSTTRVKAIRFCDSQDPLWVPGSHLNWWQRLAQHWGRSCEEEVHFACCEHCAVCPVNNGNEAPGESLVIDFESDLFEGTLLLRLRFIEGTTPEPYDDEKGYFKGVNRRYQTVVRGRFKKPLPLSHMVNGFRCDRKFGKLPAKWILRGGMKVLSFFAPQLDAKLEGDRPYSLTPLGSTAQSIAVDDPDSIPTTIESGLEEPKEAHRTLIGQSSDAPTSFQRAKLRKKVFDKFFVAKSEEPLADPSKIYTFEFLQHLFNFETFSIELGNMLGSVELEEILDGQPLQIMAAFDEQPLWSFDVWHECLWKRAKASEENERI